MKLRILSLVVFISGFALLAGSLIKDRKAKAIALESTEARSFVIHSLVSSSENGDPLTPQGFHVRAVSATGEWKETRYSFDGRVSTLAGTKDGIYVISGKSKHLYGQNKIELINNLMRSEEELRNNPQFVGTEEVAGIKTYVLRHKMGGEAYYSPLTGVTPLKLVLRDNMGSPPVMVIEALSVEFRAFSDKDINIDNLPIELDVAKARLESLKSAGASQQAQKLEQFIEEIRAKAKYIGK